MNNLEEKIERINQNISNIYNTINVLSNSILISQTNSVVDDIRRLTRNTGRPRFSDLFTSPLTTPSPILRNRRRTTNSNNGLLEYNVLMMMMIASSSS